MLAAWAVRMEVLPSPLGGLGTVTSVTTKNWQPSKVDIPPFSGCKTFSAWQCQYSDVHGFYQARVENLFGPI